MLTENNYDQVKSLLSKKKLYVFDMDGTIYLGNNPFDFAIDFIKKLRADGRKILFFTNNASRDPKTYVERLTKLGFAPTDDEICTSGNVTSAFLTRNRKGKKVYLIGTPALYRQFLSDGVDLVCDENGKPDGRDADIVVSSFDSSSWDATSSVTARNSSRHTPTSTALPRTDSFPTAELLRLSSQLQQA